MTRTLLPFVFGLSAIAAPALATEPHAAASGGASSPHAVAVEGGQNAKPRKVCKNEVATGSVMPKRVCRMVASDPAERLQQERDLDRIRERQQTGQSMMGQR